MAQKTTNLGYVVIISCPADGQWQSQEVRELWQGKRLATARSKAADVVAQADALLAGHSRRVTILDLNTGDAVDRLEVD